MYTSATNHKLEKVVRRAERVIENDEGLFLNFRLTCMWLGDESKIQ